MARQHGARPRGGPGHRKRAPIGRSGGVWDGLTGRRSTAPAGCRPPVTAAATRPTLDRHLVVPVNKGGPAAPVAIASATELAPAPVPDGERTQQALDKASGVTLPEEHGCTTR